MTFTGGHLVWLTAYMAGIVIIYELTHWRWMSVPWLPISVIGTAVAFYIGFKNNQAYDRLWEARKIWGAIVNSSRAWGAAVRAFVVGHNGVQIPDRELTVIQQRLIYRHIGWLYSLRSQLLIPTPWEHISQGRHMEKATKKRMEQFGIGLLDDDYTEKELKKFLPVDEYERLINYKNTATQIINEQAQDLKDLHQMDAIEDFRHMELQQLLYHFYEHQGKAERIKKFPLPRQYGGMSRVFVGIFIALIPFGMISTFHDLGEFGIVMAVPISVLVGWVYLVMELIGDYSENPFEGMGNDIPMLSLCRIIEIDLREMLGETDLPPNIEAKNGVLM